MFGRCNEPSGGGRSLAFLNRAGTTILIFLLDHNHKVLIHLKSEPFASGLLPVLLFSQHSHMIFTLGIFDALTNDGTASKDVCQRRHNQY